MAEVENATEVVAEAVEEGIEQAVTNIDRRMLGLGLGVGLVGGFIAGGLFANRRLRLKYEQIAEEEIEEMREHFRARLIAKEEKPDLSSEAAKIAEREGYSSPQTPVIEEDEDGAEAQGDPEEAAIAAEVAAEAEEAELVEGEASSAEVSNLFEETKKSADEDWDYEKEVAQRSPSQPYIIHVDERTDPENDYAEMSLVYYAEDDVLCDSNDQPIEDKNQVVGEANLDKFGHGSHDKHIVYIRNDVLEIDVEVIKNDGSYAEVVHGFVQHSDDKIQRRHPHFDDDPDSG